MNDTHADKFQFPHAKKPIDPKKLPPQYCMKCHEMVYTLDSDCPRCGEHLWGIGCSIYLDASKPMSAEDEELYRQLQKCGVRIERRF